MDFVVRQVAAAINEALDRLQPAELRMASGEARGKIAYNYYAPDLYDRGVSVLQARTTGGRPIGTLVNYAVHPEVLGSAQGILSPDLVGTLCDRLEQSAGGVALFMNGAQGGMVTADNRNLDAPKDPLRPTERFAIVERMRKNRYAARRRVAADCRLRLVAEIGPVTESLEGCALPRRVAGDVAGGYALPAQVPA